MDKSNTGLSTMLLSCVKPKINNKFLVFLVPKLNSAQSPVNVSARLPNG